MMKAGKKISEMEVMDYQIENSFFNDIVLWFEDKIYSVCCQCGKMNREE